VKSDCVVSCLEANDMVFNRSNSKLNAGAIGLLTGNVIDRTRLYEHGVIMALVAFKNPEIYKTYKTEKEFQ